MITLQQMLGSSSTLGPTLSTNFFESRTWIAPQDGIVIVRGMGAGGGGGASGTSATGGYSGSWGCKIVRVKKGATVSVTIGARGTGRGSSDGNGAAGGNTIITIGGVQYIAYGGPGGVSGATKTLPNGPSQSANWDFGAASVKPGWSATPTTRTGGAGVDILAQGNNATTSDSTFFSGGGGTGSKSVGTDGGGAMPGGKSAMDDAPAAPGVRYDASQGEWGISFYGGGGGGGSSGGGSGGNGGNGGGGGGSGNGGYSGGNGGNGGYGGGGGSGYSGGNGGNGGQGFAHLKFFADMGV